MVFSSIEFLFLFVPLFFGAFAVLSLLFTPLKTVRRIAHNLIILLASLLFYFWGEHFFVLVMLGSSLLDYCCGLVIGWRRSTVASGNSRPAWVDTVALVLSIIGNLGVLAYFKYADFFIENVNTMLGSIGMDSALPLVGVALPLGISFYTFQSMSYTVDVFRGNVQPTKNLLNFLTYVTMFPQLVAGPIIRYRDVEEQLKTREISSRGLVYGVERFIIGLAKKVIIADTIAGPVDAVFALPAGEVTFMAAWIATIGYSLQIYFDFSGYSDMAIGLGHILGFRFPENFIFPYIARSIRDFWRRWHISLSTWFRDYLYIPLGGSRLGPWKTYRNLFTVFLLCGFWHGAQWNFIIWGALHGLFLTLERGVFGKWLSAKPRFLQHAYTLTVVSFAFVLFRADSAGHAFDIFAAAFGANGFGAMHYSVPFNLIHIIALVLGIFFAAPLWQLRETRKGILHSPGNAVVLVRSISLLITLVVCLAIIAATTHQPFIYFRF